MIEHASTITIFIITICYSLFAVQVAYQTKWSRVPVKDAIAMSSLIAVFVLCSLSGYASTLFPEHYQFLRDPFHWVLAAAAMVLVSSNQAKVVARLLDRE